MIVKLSSDEMYPVWSECSFGDAFEVPKKLLARLRAAEEEFCAVQKEIAALVEEQSPPHRPRKLAHPPGQACHRCISEGEYHS